MALKALLRNEKSNKLAKKKKNVAWEGNKNKFRTAGTPVTDKKK